MEVRYIFADADEATDRINAWLSTVFATSIVASVASTWSRHAVLSSSLLLTSMTPMDCDPVPDQPFSALDRLHQMPPVIRQYVDIASCDDAKRDDPNDRCYCRLSTFDLEDSTYALVDAAASAPPIKIATEDCYLVTRSDVIFGSTLMPASPPRRIGIIEAAHHQIHIDWIYSAADGEPRHVQLTMSVDGASGRIEGGLWRVMDEVVAAGRPEVSYIRAGGRGECWTVVNNRSTSVYELLYESADECSSSMWSPWPSRRAVASMVMPVSASTNDSNGASVFKIDASSLPITGVKSRHDSTWTRISEAVLTAAVVEFKTSLSPASVTMCRLQLAYHQTEVKSLNYNSRQPNRRQFADLTATSLCPDLTSDGRTRRVDASSAVRDYIDRLNDAGLNVPCDDGASVGRANVCKADAVGLLRNVRLKHDQVTYSAVFQLFGQPEMIEFRYRGELTNDGRMTGFARLDIVGSQHLQHAINHIYGTFVDSRLVGRVFVVETAWQRTLAMCVATIALAADDSELTVVDGLIRATGLTHAWPVRKSESTHLHAASVVEAMKSTGISLIGHMRCGRLVDNGRPMWRGVFSWPSLRHGLLYGAASTASASSWPGSAVSDQHGVYVYPGGVYAVAGNFNDNVLTNGRQGRLNDFVVDVRCEASGLLTLNVTDEQDEAEGTILHSVHYDPSNATRIGPTSLTTADIYEVNTVTVAASKVAGDSGEGLFAVRRLVQGDLIAIYNGLPLDDAELADANSRRCGSGNGCSTYAIIDMYGITWIVPPPLNDTRFDRLALERIANSTSHARRLHVASRAFKANCAFPPASNARFGDMDHPRFGYVKTLVATRAIAPGDEVLVDYKYGPNQGHADVQWYYALRAAHWLAVVTRGRAGRCG